MSWYSNCSIDPYNGDPHMKPNRYAFLREDGSWNCVKFGGNFDNKYWIVSDEFLNEEQLIIIGEKIGVRPMIDKHKEVKTFNKLGKCVFWFRLEW